MIAAAVIALSGCSEEQITDSRLADMEDAAPGGSLGQDNLCNGKKQEAANRYGVDYVYERETQFREVSNSYEQGGLIIANIQLVDDGYIEYFHYFSRSIAFDARTGRCLSYEINA